MGVSLYRTKVSHSASETVIQHSSVRQRVVLDEADLEIKVFLEAAFQHVGLGQKKKKKSWSFHQSCFSFDTAYFSILLSSAACHLWCLQATQ